MPLPSFPLFLCWVGLVLKFVFSPLGKKDEGILLEPHVGPLTGTEASIPLLLLGAAMEKQKDVCVREGRSRTKAGSACGPP